MTAKTMSEVLADHHSKHYNGDLGTVFCLDPTCSWDAQARNFAVAADVFAQHQQDMLTAAGFGLMADAGAKALEDAADRLDRSAENLVLTWGEEAMSARAEASYAATRHDARMLRARAAAVRGEE